LHTHTSERISCIGQVELYFPVSASPVLPQTKVAPMSVDLLPGAVLPSSGRNRRLDFLNYRVNPSYNPCGVEL